MTLPEPNQLPKAQLRIPSHSGLGFNTGILRGRHSVYIAEGNSQITAGLCVPFPLDWNFFEGVSLTASQGQSPAQDSG